MNSKKKRKRKIKNLIFLMMIILGVIISYNKLEDSKIKIKDKDFIELIKSETFQEETLIERLVSKTKEKVNPLKKITEDYQKYIKESEEEPTIKEESPFIIYLYNTHQTEEYAPSSFAEFSINPTVVMNNYILQDIFNKKGFKTYVEESSIKEILNLNNWNYSNSYKASRILLEQAKEQYPTLQYFIDIHRDSLEKGKTTITIQEKDYAKILFIVGMENNNFEPNLNLTEKIHNKINEIYPGLSKGIYKKSGPGVNGVYNQDFSGNTILIEIGGYENTTTEVLNSAVAFARCFLEVIHE